MATTEAVERALPHWDLTPFFPGVESLEVRRAFDEVVRGIASLRDVFDEHRVDEGAAPSVDEAAGTIDEILDRMNAVLDEVWVLMAFVYATVAVDSRDEAGQARLSELQRESTGLRNLETRLAGWLRDVDLDAVVERSPTAKEHEFALRRARAAAEHLMPGAQEELAIELDLTGASAWSKLHRDLTSQLVVPLVLDGEERELPMSEVRNLASDRDRETRRVGYEAELVAWERASVPLAAALNSVKGQVNALAARRGWESPLDHALFENSIDRTTLDAMLGAVREALPDLRRYFGAKARALGLDRLTWYDAVAPVGAAEAARNWDFDEAHTFIVEQFGTFSDRMAHFAERAFRELWIDAEPRAGKRDGAFCMSMRRDESRVLCNYSPTFYEVSTLAHELGHGYHNLAIAGRTQIQKRTPMTLAETASIFCETIVRHGAFARAESKAEQLEIVEGALETAMGVTVDILSRFMFESSVFDGRRRRELAVSELCELMLAAQEEAYGDALDPDIRHPYMWAVKPHYYSSFSFYNFPYTFGLLFGLGLYAQYEHDPEGFRVGYDDLLSSTGLADAATLAGRFGIDVRSADFWRSSLDVVRADVDHYEQLV
jgi:pepF/M3 family oligoendopeptidase